MIVQKEARQKQRYSSLIRRSQCDAGITSANLQCPAASLPIIFTGTTPVNLHFGSRLTNKKHRRNAGFTLMELVVVMALMLVVLGLVYSFFHFTNTSFVRGGDKFQLQTNLNIASNFVIGELRNVTEIEIVTAPFTDDTSQYIYVESKVLKHRKPGTVTDKSEDVFKNMVFVISKVSKEDENDRFYLEINLQGNIRGDEGEDYDLNTKILLNNITSVTGIDSVTNSISGNTIRYKK